MRVKSLYPDYRERTNKHIRTNLYARDRYAPATRLAKHKHSTVVRT